MASSIFAGAAAQALKFTGDLALGYGVLSGLGALIISTGVYIAEGIIHNY